MVNDKVKMKMKTRSVTTIKAEIAALKAQLKSIESPKDATWVLVRENKSLVQSYHFRSQFKQKAAAVRLAEKLMAKSYKGESLVVMSYDEYDARGYSSLTRKVRTLMNGAEVEENINTPNCCSVASESYWCN